MFGKLVDLEEDEFIEEPLTGSSSKKDKKSSISSSSSSKKKESSSSSSSSSKKQTTTTTSTLSSSPKNQHHHHDEDEFDIIHRKNESSSGSVRGGPVPITEDEFNQRINSNYYSYDVYSSSEDEDDKDQKAIKKASSSTKKPKEIRAISSSNEDSNNEADGARHSGSGSKKDKTDIKALTEQQSALDKKISSNLSIIDRGWVLETDNHHATIEGELLKKSRFAAGWKKYYFVLIGNHLHYYKTKKARKPKGTITISFVTPPIPLKEKNIIDMKTANVGNYQLQLFSKNKRIDSLCASTNEEFEKWNSVLQNLVRTNLTQTDYDERLEAYTVVSPMFEEKTQVELDRLLILLQEIDTYSSNILNKTKKDKSGNLLIMEDSDDQIAWKGYYFVLIDRCLYYYKSSKLPPQGVITLKYTDISVCDSPDLKHCFKLSTPLSVFILKAKHHVAMKDWVLALNNAKEGKKLIDMPSMDKLKLNQQPRVSDEGVHQQPINGYGKKYSATLIITPFDLSPTDKPAVVKLNPGNNTIGRSDSCTITVDDKKVSRSHCKIEVAESSVIIIDLGSGHGTKVNHKRISKAYLLPGDTIKIGKTLLKLEAVKKKK
ncbi:hypothetical protein RB653_006292 [Dictyostelium firmibasis]|uniref:Uncharacterized protein n=1 Tax=Dictyostelium firmibasis TaxID=79012 RepID=A0AAN7Z021_9MYCE